MNDGDFNIDLQVLRSMFEEWRAIKETLQKARKYEDEQILEELHIKLLGLYDYFQARGEKIKDLNGDLEKLDLTKDEALTELLKAWGNLNKAIGKAGWFKRLDDSQKV